jgi:hypothetical protein
LLSRRRGTVAGLLGHVARRTCRFKATADFEWTWPTQIHRPTFERVFTVDFLAQRENVIIVAQNGLGKNDPRIRR